MQFRKSVFTLSLLLVLSCALPSHAEEKEQTLDWQAGPKAITVGDNLATIDLGKDYAFTGKDSMQRVEKAVGDPVSGNELGMIMSTDKKQNWMIYMEFQPMGYVKDDEKLDADAILKSIKESNDEVNKERVKAGGPDIQVVGWQVPPHYDKVTHNLEWELLGQSGNKNIVNANVRLLGRGGVVSITLAGNPQNVKLAQAHLDDIIKHFQYKDGNRYSDFVPGKDKVAEYGLATLVAGGLGAAAVKTGIFAKFILPILMVLKKFIVIIFAAIAGLFSKIKNFFTGKKKATDENNGSSN